MDGEEASTEERDLGRKYPYQGKDNRSIERESKALMVTGDDGDDGEVGAIKVLFQR